MGTDQDVGRGTTGEWAHCRGFLDLPRGRVQSALGIDQKCPGFSDLLTGLQKPPEHCDPALGLRAEFDASPFEKSQARSRRKPLGWFPCR